MAKSFQFNARLGSRVQMTDFWSCCRLRRLARFMSVQFDHRIANQARLIRIFGVARGNAGGALGEELKGSYR
jgi:hypothetical protein